MFTVSPGYGNIAAGGHQVITVDCFAEPAGKCEEYLIIEITDRDPEDSPGGILYTLVAESCIPGRETFSLAPGLHCPWTQTMVYTPEPGNRVLFFLRSKLRY